jgi:hypothetical protein
MFIEDITRKSASWYNQAIEAFRSLQDSLRRGGSSFAQEGHLREVSMYFLGRHSRQRAAELLSIKNGMPLTLNEPQAEVLMNQFVFILASCLLIDSDDVLPENNSDRVKWVTLSRAELIDNLDLIIAHLQQLKGILDPALNR